MNLPDSSWQTPLTTYKWMEINSDGAWNPNSTIVEKGLIRDSDRSFIFAEPTNLVCFAARKYEQLEML